MKIPLLNVHNNKLHTRKEKEKNEYEKGNLEWLTVLSGGCYNALVSILVAAPTICSLVKGTEVGLSC